MPHFFAVTAGQNNDSSLRFHAKIGENFHQYRINSVNSESLNLVCAHKFCKAKAKLLIKPEFIETTKNGKIRKNGSFRPTFRIKDYRNANLRNIKNFTAARHPTEPHSQESHDYSYFTLIRADFREKHTRSGLVEGTNQIDQTMTSLKFRERFGVQFEGRVMRNRENERKSFRRKYNYRFPHAGKMVPFQAQTIPLTNFGTLEVEEKQFFQHQENDFCIFYLEQELNLLESTNFISRTFSVVRDIDEYTQIYLFCVLWRKPDGSSFTYPYIFCFMKKKSAATYTKIFRFMKLKFEEKFKRPLKVPEIFSDSEIAIFRPIKSVSPIKSVCPSLVPCPHIEELAKKND